MKCLNENTIEDFINNRFSEDEDKNIIAHLSECEKCFANVIKGTLMEKLAQPGSNRIITAVKGKAACLSKKLLLGYAVGGLEKTGMAHVEDHLGECNKCVAQLKIIQRRNLEERAIGIDLSKPVSGKTKRSENSLMISLVEDIAKKIYEVVKHTGEIRNSHFPALASAARGNLKISKGKTILIEKKFEDKGISLEVEVARGLNFSSNLKLSLMKMKGGSISGIAEKTKVLIKGANLIKEAETDNRGEAEFKNLPAGTYRVFFDNGMEVRLEIKKK